MIDVGKILRILERTSSTHDPEALVAIRKANELLEAAGMRWIQFFDYLLDTSDRGKFDLASTPTTSRGRPKSGKMAESQIGEIFDEVDDYSHLLSPNQADWVERMRTAWEGAGTLSERQEEIVTNIRDELRDKAERRGGSR